MEPGNKMISFLKNQDIALVKLSEEDDLSSYFSFINDVDNLIWLDGVGNFPLNKKDLIEHIGSPDMLLLGIIDHKKEHVGNIQLSCINFQHRNAMLGLILAKEYQGKGYALSACRLFLQHAFEILNLHRIFLTVIGGNNGAIKLYKKLGFQEEGRERDMHLVNSVFHDGIRFSLLKKEYIKMQKELMML
jgi:[ribosomal protein S5]-alanine N-acetyltransferase